MTALVDIVNRALQVIGTRTTVSSSELTNNGSNEAIQANLVLTQFRDQLLRMAPWNCATDTVPLVYITSAPGTPENTSPQTPTWQKGQPPPPWAYEYQYPYACLKPLYIIPQLQTGFASGIPITTAVTGGAPSFWNGPPVKYKVGIDQFFMVNAAAVVSGGTGYNLNDTITLATTPPGAVPIGAPAVLIVTGVAAGVITSVNVVAQIQGDINPAIGGSYFNTQANPVAQSSTSGTGTGATFNLTYTANQQDQRIILTNQEFAVLTYIKQVSDPNVMDPLFLEAWSEVLGANLAIALTGDKGIANQAIARANAIIGEARKADGNEGLTINDVTPDFIRVRGIAWTDTEYSPNNMSLDWGAFWPAY